MFGILETVLPGCFEVRAPCSADPRGSFVKLYHADAFRALGLDAPWREQYISRSRRGVLRGLHFQLPPHDHAKRVTCLQGEVLDAVVDLRVGSPAFGRHCLVRMDGRQASQLYIPRGMAHGFLALSDEALLLYDVETVHAPGSDAGIRWDSAGIAWPARDPILSARDAGLPAFGEFASPFLFRAEGG